MSIDLISSLDVSVADLRGCPQTPPTDQNFLNFMQFFGKIGQICMLVPPPEGLVPIPTRNPGSAPACDHCYRPQGNVFTSLCHSVHRRWEVSASWSREGVVCLWVQEGDVCLWVRGVSASGSRRAELGRHHPPWADTLVRCTDLESRPPTGCSRRTTL